MEIEGVVQQWLFRNPHPVLYVQAPDADGEIRVFEIGFAPATVLAKRGWSTETFQEGDVIHKREGTRPRRQGPMG